MIILEKELNELSSVSIREIMGGCHPTPFPFPDPIPLPIGPRFPIIPIIWPVSITDFIINF